MFDEKRYFVCGKGFRKLMFKLLIWYIARERRADQGDADGYALEHVEHVLAAGYVITLAVSYQVVI